MRNPGSAIGAIAAMVIVLALASVSVAIARVRFAPPVRVRIVAYIGEKVAGTRPEFAWTVASKGTKYELFVMHLQVLTSSVTPLDIDAALAPYAVKFQVVGEKTALAKFRSTPPQQQVVLWGILRLDGAGRYLLLDRVDAAEPATPAP